MNKIRRAWPLAKLIAQLGFSSAAMVLWVSWMCGDRYFILGLEIGVWILGAAGLVALLVLVGAPLILDEDTRGLSSCSPGGVQHIPSPGTAGRVASNFTLGNPPCPAEFRDAPRTEEA